MKTRRVPMRTCVGCRSVRPKKELIRVVRDPEGAIWVDATGKRAGRGAYLCPSEECLQAAVGGKRLERALERALPADVIQSLKEQLGAL